jgi:hypothetical protein
VESIVVNINQYLESSILFIKQTLTEQPKKYRITGQEYHFLKLEVEYFPIDEPQLTFWEGSTEWQIRFAEGKFDICDPFGIAVTYNFTNPISVENLEDSETINS